MSQPHGTWLPTDLCKDLSDDSGCDASRSDWDDCSGSDRHGRRKRREIPIGNVSVDCTPVSFRTPGQAVNIVSCPVSEVVKVPVTRQVNVQLPLGIGDCVLNVPLTEQVQVPVFTTVNLPPLQIPHPSLICPSLISPIGFC